MIKTIRLTMFLFYNYYRGGRWERVPYFHALCSMSFLLFLHVAALLCWVNREQILFGGDKGIFVVKFALLFTTAAIGFWRLAPEKALRSMKPDETKIRRSGWLLVLYWILIMALLILGMIY